MIKINSQEEEEIKAGSEITIKNMKSMNSSIAPSNSNKRKSLFIKKSVGGDPTRNKLR